MTWVDPAVGPPFEFSARPNEPVVEISRWFHAPATTVFAAWTTPEHVCRWWGTLGLSVVSCDVDLRVGGRYRYVLQAADGRTHTLDGTFVEIDPPHRLVTNFVLDAIPDDQVVEVSTFDDAGGGTIVHIVSLHRTGGARDRQLAEGDFRAGMMDRFARLDEVLARQG